MIARPFSYESFQHLSRRGMRPAISGLTNSRRPLLAPAEGSRPNDHDERKNCCGHDDEPAFHDMHGEKHDLIKNSKVTEQTGQGNIRWTRVGPRAAMARICL